MTHKHTLEIDGYIRAIEKKLYPAIIPSTINHLVYSFYDPWFKIKDFPEKLTLVYPNPVSYHSSIDDKYYIIICPLQIETNNIYQYSVFNDDWQIITKYPDKLYPKCHGTIIDRINEELYILHGQNGVFAKYNLKTKQWKIYCHSSEHKSDQQRKYNIINSSNPWILWIPEPIHELHAMLEDSNKSYGHFHIKYNDTKSKFVNVSNGIKNNSNAGNGCFVRAKINDIETLFILGPNEDFTKVTDKIWYCYINKQKQCEWKLSPQAMPEKNLSKSAVCYGQIIILCVKQEIFYLEIEDCAKNTNEWIKCNIKTEKVRYTFKLIIVNGYLYFINLYGISNKIHLSNILPLPLYLKYLNH